MRRSKQVLTGLGLSILHTNFPAASTSMTLSEVLTAIRPTACFCLHHISDPAATKNIHTKTFGMLFSLVSWLSFTLSTPTTSRDAERSSTTRCGAANSRAGVTKVIRLWAGRAEASGDILWEARPVSCLYVLRDRGCFEQTPWVRAVPGYWGGWSKAIVSERSLIIVIPAVIETKISCRKKAGSKMKIDTQNLWMILFPSAQ